MTRIFMDVGAHTGETAEIVLGKKYHFDRVCCFEPALECHPSLNKIALLDSRLEVYRYGLSSSNSEVSLFNPGSLSASVFRDDHGSDSQTLSSQKVLMVDIADFLLEETKPDDFIVLKLNCEGGEVEILHRLLKLNLLSCFYTILITFDIREFPGGIAKERRLRRLLRQVEKPNFCFSDDIMVGPTHADRISNWLDEFGVNISVSDSNSLRRDFEKVFGFYSRKSGIFPMLEVAAKSYLGYKHAPSVIKEGLRFFKRLVGLNRERVVRKL
jgi:FkbM family methyltransferase